MFGATVNVPCMLDVEIYNRWGAKVANTTQDISTPGFVELWNGHGFNDGVYFYVLRATPDFGDMQVLKGNVTLVREMKLGSVIGPVLLIHISIHTFV